MPRQNVPVTSGLWRRKTGPFARKTTPAGTVAEHKGPGILPIGISGSQSGTTKDQQVKHAV
jgi:hypothetical protein